MSPVLNQEAEVGKHEQESLKIPVYLPSLEHSLRIDFSLLDLRGRHAVTCEPHQAAWDPAMRPFLPQYRMAFAVQVRIDGESKPD
jgi:hypothetical protein